LVFALLEHLHAHESAIALAEFRRMLQADGFVIITCPVCRAARMLEVEDIEHVAYHSPAGPSGILDILYGHARSISWVAFIWRTGQASRRPPGATGGGRGLSRRACLSDDRSLSADAACRLLGTGGTLCDDW